MAYATSQVRRDVSTNWNSSTILLDGELGFETDTGKLKVGYSGITWGSLGYIQGVTGPTGSTQGLQYSLTGTTIGGTFTSYSTGTTFPVASTNIFTQLTGITFKVPPNWSANNSVSWDGWAFYDFNQNNTNYWAVYYTTNLQSTEQPLIGAKDKDDSIVYTSPQTYLPMNLIIPPTHLQAGPTGTINLRIYATTSITAAVLSNIPQISGRVGVVVD